MTRAGQIALLMLVAGLLLLLGGCSQSGCNGTGFGSSGNSSGTSGGAPGSGGVCGGSNGGGGNNGSISDFLYYLGQPDTQTNNLQGITLSSTGTFAAISNFTAPTFALDNSQNLLIVNKQYLYVPQPTLNQIQAFSINRTTGALTPINGSPFPSLGGSYLAADPQGRFLFVGNSSSGAISVFQINAASGMLTLNPSSPFPTGLLFSAFPTVDGQGQYLFVNQGSGVLDTGVYSIDQTSGGIQAIAGSPFPPSLYYGQIASPTGAASEFFVGFSFLSGDNNLYVSSVATASGMPTPVTNSPFATANAPFWLAIHPSGKFVYSFEEDSQQNLQPFEGFKLDSTSGALTAIQGSPFTNLSSIIYCQFDQGGTAFCETATGFMVVAVDGLTGVPSNSIPQLPVANNPIFAVTN